MECCCIVDGVLKLVSSMALPGAHHLRASGRHRRLRRCFRWSSSSLLLPVAVVAWVLGGLMLMME
ncbi:hypothetical protein Dsin_009038 [Dipteronia sinensis]|uniref:Uncharacterized protein n=1 Tax=Dipteronia sinensis TaxID=43782 RepID=A0AAE0APV2_9ROSI|nr:hypothetical protein Dsin_009038 [Dipteronia sinensis]